MSKTFNLYCDESTHLPNDGCPYMLYAYISIPINQLKKVKADLKALKKKFGFEGEWKWTNVHTATLPMYEEVIKYFFSCAALNFRTVVVDKRKIDQSRQDYTYDDFYFKMYFQLLHHKVDLESSYNIYFDIKDTRSQQRLAKLRDILKYNASIRNFQFMRSHESTLMQLCDLIMGAINYNLRTSTTENAIPGTSQAKRTLVDLIQRISHNSLTSNTPKYAEKVNLFFINLKNN